MANPRVPRDTVGDAQGTRSAALQSNFRGTPRVVLWFGLLRRSVDSRS